MMDSRLSDETRAYQRHCHRFAEEIIRPAAAQYDRTQQVPWEIIREARAWGLHGLDHIQSMATDSEGLRSVIYAEELHWGCAGIALAIQASSLAAAGIASSGTREQIDRWTPAVFALGDEIRLGAYAVTEAGAGSDVKSLRTTARREGDEGGLNGTNAFLSHSATSDS